MCCFIRRKTTVQTIGQTLKQNMKISNICRLDSTLNFRSRHRCIKLKYITRVVEMPNYICKVQIKLSFNIILFNISGHLVWRIKDFSKKLEEAKQYDTILHSAMFSNKPFGYSLRVSRKLFVFLNYRVRQISFFWII